MTHSQSRDSRTKITFSLSKAGFAAIAAAASTDESRVNLTSIGLYADGRLAATDGHRLALRLGSDGLAPTAPIARLRLETAKNALRVMRKSDTIEIAVDSAEGAIFLWIYSKDRVLRWDTEDATDTVGAFPPVHAVVPRGAPKPSSFAVNGAYLAEAAKTLGAVAAESDCPKSRKLEVYTYGELDPIVFRAGDFVHVLMPMRARLDGPLAGVDHRATKAA